MVKVSSLQPQSFRIVEYSCWVQAPNVLENLKTQLHAVMKLRQLPEMPLGEELSTQEISTQ